MKPFLRNNGLPLIITISFLFFTLGCAEVSVSQPKTGEVQSPPTMGKKQRADEKEGQAGTRADEWQKLYRAEQAQSQSRHSEALELYRDFIQAYPDSPLIDQARFSVAQVLQKTGQIEPAIVAYREVLEKHPQSVFSNEARFRLTRLLSQSGRLDEAAQNIKPLLEKREDKSKIYSLFVLLGHNAQEGKNFSQALEFYGQALKIAGDRTGRLEARALILTILIKMPLEDLAQIRSRGDYHVMPAYQSYILAHRWHQTGAFSEAGVELRNFHIKFSEHELAGQANQLRQAIQKRTPPPPLIFPRMPAVPKYLTASEEENGEKISPSAAFHPSNLACVLPLSGGAARYGQEVLKGLQLAFKLYQPQTEGFKSELVILDSKSDPELTLQTIDRLAQQKDIMAVVGPMTSKVVAAASEKAQQKSLPMINFSQLKDTPTSGRYIFRMFLTPEAQAKTVAEYAVQVLGLTRLAILHPDDAYGRKMRDAFWDRVNRLEAEVVDIQSYPPDTTDFSTQIQNLTGVKKVERRVEAGYTVPVNFDAVFIPDGYNAIAMIAPQFVYHDVTEIRLLGTSLWHTPRLLSTTSRYIQKSILPVNFYLGSERVETKRFIKAFREENEDQEPGKYAAYGFDAGTLLLTLMDRDLISTREDLIEALAQIIDFPGATGDISFSEEGEFITEPVLLTVIGDEFRLIQKSNGFF